MQARPQRIIASLLLSVAVAFTGCGKKDDDKRKAAKPAPAAPRTALNKLAAHCSSPDPLKDVDVQGENVDQLFPIASVSKVMTSFWAVSKMGAGTVFETTIHIKPIANSPGLFDVHIEGTRDPYSDQAMFQLVVGQLNKDGIKRVRKLSYDENFKFKRDIRGVGATAYLKNGEPTPATVEFQIKTMLASLSADYEFLRVKSAAINVALPESLALEVAQVKFTPKAEFKPRSYPRQSKYRSSPLRTFLKEMNRNSNNYAATQIFQALGGPVEFKKFMKETLGFEETEVLFYNGSGNRLDLESGKSVYNQATCRAVMKTVQALNNEIEAQANHLHQVLTVSGRANPEEPATNLDVYTNEKTSGVLIAKTGTVGPAVTLAGLLKTTTGSMYFGYVHSTTESNEVWKKAREVIRDHLFALADRVTLGNEIDYVPKLFMQFDTACWERDRSDAY